MSASFPLMAVCAKALLREEGVSGLAKGMIRHGRIVSRRVLSVSDFYIYRYPISFFDESRFRPEVEHLDVREVESLKQVGLLVAEGLEDPRVKVRSMTQRLAAGAVALCLFADERLAYVGWMATTARAKWSFDRLPYRVAFDDGEAATGGAWTVPQYRGLGLYRYGFGRELRYLRSHGRTVCCNAIPVRNLASQRGQAFYDARVCARARLTRVLGFRKWREWPMSGPCPCLRSAPRTLP